MSSPVGWWKPCLVAFGLACCVAAGQAESPHRTLYEASSRFGALEVTEAAGIRYLFVDGVLQTAMYADRARVTRECHLFSKRYWLELLPYLRGDAKDCLLIGLGGGLLPAALEGYGVATHGVEIDPLVFKVACEYFGYNQEATVGDGRAFLAQSQRRHDFIVIDAFAGASFPYSLATRECFELAKERLSPSGVLALNLISRPTGSAVSASVARTLSAVFSHVAVYRTEASERVQSLICFASVKPLRLSLHSHGEAMGVTSQQLERLNSYLVVPSSAQSVVLTDGRNPLAAEWAKEAEEWRQRMVQLFGRR